MICEFYDNKKCKKPRDVKCSQFRKEDKSCYSTLYETLELKANIICQNCGKKLAQWENNKNKLILDPNKIITITQELTKDTTLETIQCPNCGCCLQIKI